MLQNSHTRTRPLNTSARTPPTNAEPYPIKWVCAMDKFELFSKYANHSLAFDLFQRDFSFQFAHLAPLHFLFAQPYIAVPYFCVFIIVLSIFLHRQSPYIYEIYIFKQYSLKTITNAQRNIVVTLKCLCVCVCM